MTGLAVVSVTLLVVSGLVAVPQYLERGRGTPSRPQIWLYCTALVQILLLGAAAVVALLSGGGAGWAVSGPLAVLAATVGGGSPTVAVLRLSFNASHPEHQRVLTGPEGEQVFNEEINAQPVLRGGAWIGVLERLAVASTLIMGWPEGLAIILAVKALGRYSELGKSGAAERFILGTFASQLWACACVGVAVLLA
ncbi:hypothetical protein [Citricoccus zhacaiensis]|uniref:hypothetical protein n=1 Tax=Citricoccus zhacaiensis TaxID=489142 RepID=UPI00166F12E7|nr:hypothetical protein [Citricoccus zhacaiensis]